MSRSESRPTVTVNGIHELTRVWEPAEESPRCDVVLVHGISDHSGRWEHVGDQLSDAGFRVESFDLVGWGASGGPRGDISDWTVYLDQVQGHLEPLLDNGRPTVLYGHSMGGLIAAEYLVAERPKPDLAILSAPALHAGAPWQHMLSRVLAPVVGRVRLPTNIKGEDLSTDPAVGEAYFADPLVNTSPTIRFGQLLFAAMARTAPVMADLEVPTLVIHGADDPTVLPSATEPLGQIAVAERRVYPGIRHELHNAPAGPEIVGEIVDWISDRL